ncbi:5-carboxymethyl-2-hydroxymuconate Delta-isomerase [Aquirhabdus parva]|uniref:5-carboxymethyl-2-hydroxymuconate Delta-isomerase n=1 Tax=Aquirhabdus parva TaxID=2283318 RepID=A0A345PA60_9GAMM|nr:5-carboxymethyl-2-hydroxymuconate Delta-isomerase [Aquirhabdus parva]AXI04169.1 5-carboxymethyl-2-hydroxymuconate Delta-isomerase [Aquirhabdus parva]
MPHLTLEYTDNLTDVNVRDALNRLNLSLIESGLFDEVDIKSRAIPLSIFQVGAASEARAFVHVRLSILKGRTLEVQQALSQRLLNELNRIFVGYHAAHLQLCVEITEIATESYAKAVINPHLR